MALITLPEDPVKWRVSSWGLLRADAVQEFMNGARQVTAYQKAVWGGQIQLPALNDDDAARLKWRAALMQLSRLSNTFELGAPDAQAGPSTGYAGALNVAGADQLGLTLAFAGATPSASILNAGDYFHVVAAGVKELKMATANVAADGSGEGVIAFEPALRNSPADSGAIVIAAPRCAFALTTPQVTWQNALGGFSEFTIDFVEAF